MSQTLDPAILQQLWRISPATLAMTLSMDDPQPWRAAQHLTILSQWIVTAISAKGGPGSRIIVNMPPRHGKPVHVDTPVLMADGSRKPLAEVQVDDFVITGYGRPRRVLAVHEQGELPCVRITTESGRAVVAALDHPFMTTRGWMKAGELGAGDVLALPANVQTVAGVDRTDAEFRLAGYFVGDGSTGINKAGAVSCNITCFDADVAKDIEAQAGALGWRYRWTKTGRVDFRADTGKPRPWLRDSGLAGKNSHTKRVPEWVFWGTASQIAHFVSAYFLCDGTINKRGQKREDACFEFYSVNRDLLADVRHLLFRIGVRSRLAQKNGRYEGQKHQSYRLTISGRDDVARFLDVVPLIGAKLMKAVSWRVVPQRFRGDYLEDAVASVEPLQQPQPCRCLTVNQDETFLADDLVVHNSELISKWTPVWFLENWPHKQVINTGYGTSFAEEWGRKVRNLVLQHQAKLHFQLAQDSKAAGRWNTVQGGGMYATGTGGGITGRGADLLIIDDPIKDSKEANSLTFRDALWQWYTETARSRVMPGAAQILLMTRWHDDDLAGRLIRASENGTGERWEVLNLPALAIEGQEDPLGRKPGEPLWPDFRPLEYLQDLQRGMSAEAWAAQYQGTPGNLAAIGNVYKAFGPKNIRPCVFDPRRPLVWSLDFNVDPMCSAICQWHEEVTPYTYLTNERRNVIGVLDEVCLPNSNTLEACDEFVSRTEPYRQALQGRTLHVRVYGDRNGQSRKTVGDSDYVAIQDYFRQRRDIRITLHVPRGQPAVRDRVNAVNAMLCNAAGEVRTFIDPKCKRLIADFKQVQWKRDSSGNTTGQIDKSDMNLTHVSDAYGYFVVHQFGMKSQAGFMTGVAQ